MKVLLIPLLFICVADAAQHQVSADPGAAQVETLQHQLQQLMSLLQKQQLQMNQVRDIVAKQESTMAGHEAKMQQQQQQMKDLDQQSKDKDRQIKDLEQRINDQEQLIQEEDIDNLQVKDQDRPIKDQDQRIQDLEQRIQDLEQRIREEDIENLQVKANMANRIMQNLNETVAFSAYATNPAVYNVGQTIMFESVHFNSGSYNPEFAIFQCPVDGLYFFTITVNFLLQESESFRGMISLKKGQNELADVRSNYAGANSQIYENSSNSVLILCEEGELVFAEAVEVSRVHSTDVTYRTTFTGILMAV